MVQRGQIALDKGKCVILLFLFVLSSLQKTIVSFLVCWIILRGSFASTARERSLFDEEHVRYPTEYKKYAVPALICGHPMG